MPRRAVVLALVVVAAGCGGGGGGDVPAASPGRLVLAARDVGPAFSSFYRGPQTALDNQGTPRAKLQRYGREAGYVTRLRRAGSASTAGPLVVESRVDVFRSADGATKDLAAYRQILAATPGLHRRTLKLPVIGDSAAGVSFVQPGPVPTRYYRIAWRYRNATASVTAQGFAGKLRLRDVLALVRKQQQHLRRM